MQIQGSVALVTGANRGLGTGGRAGGGSLASNEGEPHPTGETAAVGLGDPAGVGAAAPTLTQPPDAI
jgi:hypothetical protein